MSESAELGRLAAAAGAVVVAMAAVLLGATLAIAPATTISVVPTGVPSRPEAAAAAGTVVLPPSPPTMLEIPAIGVATGTLIELGSAADGSMELPGTARSLGWFTGSAAPGEPGAAIITGYADYGYLRGAFYRLRELPVGAAVSVRRADGRTAVFTAYRVESYPRATPVASLIDAGQSAAELRLITCRGVYDEDGDQSDKVVVSAKLTGVQAG